MELVFWVPATLLGRRQLCKSWRRASFSGNSWGGTSSEAPSLLLSAQIWFPGLSIRPWMRSGDDRIMHICTLWVSLFSPNSFTIHLLFPQFFPVLLLGDPIYSQWSLNSNCWLPQNIKWCVVYKHNDHSLLQKATLPSSLSLYPLPSCTERNNNRKHIPSHRVLPWNIISIG